MTLATNIAPGEIQLAGDLAGNNDATAPELTDLGITPGSYALPTLSVDNKGRVTAIVGDTDVTPYIDDATTIDKGLVQINDTGLDVAAGVLSVNFTEVADNLRDATTSVKGLVQINDTNGLSITSGEVSVDLATNTTFGVVKSADTDNITITGGLVDVGPNVVLSTTDVSWTGVHTYTFTTLTYGTTIAVDASLSNMFKVTLTGDATLSNPTNLAAGGFYTFVISQDVTGSRTLAFGSSYQFPAGLDTTIDATANEETIVSCVYDGSRLLCSLTKGF